MDFYSLNGGKFTNCIEKKVTKIDNEGSPDKIQTWEVLFSIGDTCKAGTKQDILMVVIVNASGEIESTYPDSRLFSDQKFCNIDKDCLGSDSAEVICKNYIHGSLEGFAENEKCLCINNQCQFSDVSMPNSDDISQLSPISIKK
jgi:hypothetical protein